MHGRLDVWFAAAGFAVGYAGGQVATTVLGGLLGYFFGKVVVSSLRTAGVE